MSCLNPLKFFIFYLKKNYKRSIFLSNNLNVKLKIVIKYIHNTKIFTHFFFFPLGLCYFILLVCFFFKNKDSLTSISCFSNSYFFFNNYIFDISSIFFLSELFTFFPSHKLISLKEFLARLKRFLLI